ncbi:Uncharacterised protein [Mycobacteroides abscessus subsp. abscessus]|nr:Uncharacterised protein [Mycobacteroides abscessus subsp. abscessus]
MPNGPPNPWSESNSPSLRQNQGGSIREMRRPLTGRHAQKARNNPDWRDTSHGPH